MRYQSSAMPRGGDSLSWYSVVLRSWISGQSVWSDMFTQSIKPWQQSVVEILKSSTYIGAHWKNIQLQSRSSRDKNAAKYQSCHCSEWLYAVIIQIKVPCIVGNGEIMKDFQFGDFHFGGATCFLSECWLTWQKPFRQNVNEPKR